MYREEPPLSPALHPLVERVWTLRADGPDGGRPHRVLPDGCMDVIFSLGGAPREEAGDALRPPHYAVGTMTRPLEVRHAGPLDLVGVRFRPGAASAFLDAPAARLTDGHLPLDEAWGALAEETWDRLAEAPVGWAARTTVVEEALLRTLRDGRHRLDHGVMAACRALEAARRTRRVDDLVREAGVGRRQLERRFQAAVGLSPGAAVRVQRFRRALRLLAARPPLPLARVALDAGYYDQAHLTREFRALAGETPGRWRSGGGAAARSVGDDASVQDAAGTVA